MDIISRDDAKLKDLKKYFTGKPCRHGHVCERYTKGGVCFECSAKSTNRWYSDNQDKVLITAHRSRKKIRGYPDPPRQRPENGLCELCGRIEKKKQRLSLDHCHETGKFRGWLCHDCNTNIGKFGDNISGLMKAISYLELTEEPILLCY